MNQSPFTPGPTISFTLGATQTISLGTGAGTSGTPQVVLSNGSTICFIKFGSSSVTAAVTDFPILANATVCLTPPVGTTSLAAVGTAGTLYATVGHGLLG